MIGTEHTRPGCILFSTVLDCQLDGKHVCSHLNLNTALSQARGPLSLKQGAKAERRPVAGSMCYSGTLSSVYLNGGNRHLYLLRHFGPYLCSRGKEMGKGRLPFPPGTDVLGIAQI